MWQSIGHFIGEWARPIEEGAAVIGILLAYVHAYHLRRQVKSVSELARWLPTHPIGLFPTYLRDIVTLLNNARESITIVCDYPAYGVFSDPRTYFRYCQTLETRIHEHVKVRVTCLDNEHRDARTTAEFARYDKTWDQWRRAHLTNIRELLLTHGGHDEPANTVTRDEIVKLVTDDDYKVLTGALQNAQRVDVVAEDMCVYFWLVDNREAIFSIPSFAEAGDERGFYTRDADLIAGLREIRRRLLARHVSEETDSASVA